MSDTILRGLNRKTGKWENIVEAGASYDANWKVYNAIAGKQPVNDDYSKVQFARLQNIATPLTLITTAEAGTAAEARLAQAKDFAGRTDEAVNRQEVLRSQAEELQAKERARVIDEKNAGINKLRQATGQEAFDASDYEKSEADRLAKLPKASAPIPREEIEKQLSRQKATEAQDRVAQLAEKNELTEKIKNQALTGQKNFVAPAPKAAATETVTSGGKTNGK